MAGRAPTEGTTGGAPHTHPGVLRGVGVACTWRWPPPRATPNWYRRGVPARGPPRANKRTEPRKKWDSGRWGGPGASEHPRLGLDSVAAEGGLNCPPPQLSHEERPVLCAAPRRAGGIIWSADPAELALRRRGKPHEEGQGAGLTCRGSTAGQEIGMF